MGRSQAHWGYGVLAALVAGATALFSLALVEPASAGDKNCDDFKNQAKAQKFFKKHNPKEDPHYLDSDNDGIACEDNPCPCKKKPAFRASLAVAQRRASCDRINLGGRKIFYKNQMNCRTAKTYARRLYRTKGDSAPKGFKCFTGSQYQEGANCRDKRNDNRFFGWHPLD